MALCRSRGPEGAGVSIITKDALAVCELRGTNSRLACIALGACELRKRRSAPQNSMSSSPSPPGRPCMSWAGKIVGPVMKSGACRPTI